MSCAAFWTSTRGEADDQLRELDFAGASADARLDLVALPMAGRGACGFICGGVRGMPKRFGTLCAGGRSACVDDGIAGHHIHLVGTSSEVGLADGGRGSFDVGGDAQAKCSRAVTLPRCY